MSKVMVQLDGFIRPWDDPDKGIIRNVPTVDRKGGTVISGVSGDQHGWFDLPPEVAEKLEKAVEAAELASGMEFQAIVDKPLFKGIYGYRLVGAIRLP